MRNDILGSLVDLVLPRPCAGCGRPDCAWCERCHAELSRLRQVHRPALAHGPPAYALAWYTGAARRAVLAYKEQRAHALAGPFAVVLADVLPFLPPARAGPDGTWWLVCAPSRRAAARPRGGDHMHRLGRACARALRAVGRPAVAADVLRLSRGVVDSVGLDAAGRLRNLAGRVRVRPAGLPPPGTPVVLLDDVITTGATVAACARALGEAGVPVSAALALTATR